MSNWNIEHHNSVELLTYSNPPHNLLTITSLLELGDIFERLAKGSRSTEMERGIQRSSRLFSTFFINSKSYLSQRSPQSTAWPRAVAARSRSLARSASAPLAHVYNNRRSPQASSRAAAVPFGFPGWSGPASRLK